MVRTSRIPFVAPGLRWALVIAWMAVLYLVSAQSVVPSLPTYPLIDLITKKTGHITGYTILMTLLLFALSGPRSTPFAPTRAQLISAFLIGLAYAASDEFHQSFTPGRTSLWTDVVIFDMTGLLISAVLMNGARLARSRSPIAWLYAALFLYSIALVILLNLPYHGKVEQDASLLLRDPWFLWVFSYFGLLIVPIAALLIEDGARRGMRWLGYVLPYFVIGVIPLSAFMARRPRDEQDRSPSTLLQRLLNLRLVWLVLLLALIGISIVWLPHGSFAQLLDTLHRNTGFWFMPLDIVLNHVLVLPLLQADLRRRNIRHATLWLAATLLTGPLGLCLYMLQRPVLQAQPSANRPPTA